MGERLIMGSEALPGGHYCGEHQGNTSYYSKENCELCRLKAEVAVLRAKEAGVQLTTDQVEARRGLHLQLRYRPMMKVAVHHKEYRNEADRADPEVVAARRQLDARVEKFMADIYGGLPRFVVRRIVDGRTSEPMCEAVMPYDAKPSTALAIAARNVSAKIGDEIFVSEANWGPKVPTRSTTAKEAEGLTATDTKVLTAGDEVCRIACETYNTSDNPWPEGALEAFNAWTEARASLKKD
jgi:hypothetical protein